MSLAAGTKQFTAPELAKQVCTHGPDAHFCA